MSADSGPISPERFASALKELPIGSLHGKAAELRNSINHLVSSNEQIREYLLSQPPEAPADADCVEAIQENVRVIKRMEERVGLVKAEVESRGLPWPDEEQMSDVGALQQREPGEEGSNGLPNGTSVAQGSQRQSGRLTDEELARRLRERLGDPEEPGEDGEGGLHL